MKRDSLIVGSVLVRKSQSSFGTLRKSVLALLFALVFSIPVALGQSAAPSEPLKIGDIMVCGSLRTRVESWDWFKGNANNDYTFPGSILRVSLSESTKLLDWQLELAAPFLLGLPDDAIAAAPQGQLGFGASYFVANRRDRNTGMAFAKQGFLHFKNLGGIEGQSLKVGRMQFIDGTEVAPKNSTLATLKRDRIAHRLIGDFGFSDVGRSFDGVEFTRNGSRLHLTLFGGRPTRGVFQVDGWGEVNINVYYGALTGQVGGKQNSGEWRVFGLGYQDLRDGVLKTDNRPAPIRAADTGHINIGTFGGHYIHTVDTGAGRFDVLGWLALQTGSWGRLRHRAEAFAVEAGWQPRILPRLKPWLRGGYDYGSGDKNAADSTHGTFFQVLPTPRIYARFPFFNMMNMRDGFGELILRPAKKVTVRSDIHTLSLHGARRKSRDHARYSAALCAADQTSRPRFAGRYPHRDVWHCAPRNALA
jgi:alginate export protein